MPVWFVLGLRVPKSIISSRDSGCAGLLGHPLNSVHISFFWVISMSLVFPLRVVSIDFVLRSRLPNPEITGQLVVSPSRLGNVMVRTCDSHVPDPCVQNTVLVKAVPNRRSE